jgi:tripartite-type tricarboxylate transporter receptor subunit TctC
MASFIQRTGMKAAAVTVRGGAEAINNLMAGHVPMAFMNASDVTEFVHAGKVRVIAITSPARVPQLPGVPTMIEEGYPDFKMVTWNGLAAPADTPKVIVEKLAAAVKKTLAIQKNRDLFAKLVVEPVGNTPDEFTAEIDADMKVWGEAIRASGGKPAD